MRGNSIELIKISNIGTMFFKSNCSVVSTQRIISHNSEERLLIEMDNSSAVIVNQKGETKTLMYPGPKSKPVINMFYHTKTHRIVALFPKSTICLFKVSEDI